VALSGSQQERKPVEESPRTQPKSPETKPAQPRRNEAPKQQKKAPEPRPPEKPYDLKGDRLGMSLQAFKANHRRVFNAGKLYEAPFCSDGRDDAARESGPIETMGEEPWHPKAKVVNARITFPFEDSERGTNYGSSYVPALAGVKTKHHHYSFVDGRLYEIYYAFPQSRFAQIQEAMVTTYGKPKSVDVKEYQNGFGAKFTGKVCIWDNGTSNIVLMERFGDLKTSGLMLTHKELLRVVGERRRRLNKL
jgi:hypothetical protein